MKKKIYSYVVLQHKDGVTTMLDNNIRVVLADTEEQARTIIAMGLKDVKPEEVEIVISLFK